MALASGVSTSSCDTMSRFNGIVTDAPPKSAWVRGGAYVRVNLIGFEAPVGVREAQMVEGSVVQRRRHGVRPGLAFRKCRTAFPGAGQPSVRPFGSRRRTAGLALPSSGGEERMCLGREVMLSILDNCPTTPMLIGLASPADRTRVMNP